MARYEGHGRKADRTAGARDAPLADAEDPLCDGGAHPLRQRGGEREIRVLAHHHELIATPAHDEILGTQLATQDLGHLHQHCIAGER